MCRENSSGAGKKITHYLKNWGGLFPPEDFLCAEIRAGKEELRNEGVSAEINKILPKLLSWTLFGLGGFGSEFSVSCTEIPAEVFNDHNVPKTL